MGAEVQTLEVDLSTPDGVDQLITRARSSGRPVEALFANAGQGLGKGFLDQDWNDILSVVNTNVTGTLRLLHEDRPRYARPRFGQDPDHRLDRRPDARDLSGRL